MRPPQPLLALAFVTLFFVGCAAQDGAGELTPIPAPADVASPASDATRTDSGLFYKVLTVGNGATPTTQDRVQVHYTGWTIDGEMFDSSVARGAPATFGVTDVIAGWTEGLQLMQVGATHRLWIPEALAYRGTAGRPAGMLVFDVQLLDVYAPN
jgi:FKBP-type peptidyl-prolyl cis-trans isomerase